eukprot:maker-scaffold229_size244821-snap-gene-1.12 protein:Tk01405 transcript:maker-scaffold229_size244821-snap-gene-1.12-mRNA-1 annotation:"PREDICTED: uncharacterized protein LOC100370263"
MPQESEAKTQTTFSVKPRQMLKTKEFYLMWVSFLAMNVINMFINNYQKSFGQIYIKDDSFFAIVATASSVTNGFSRILWGYAYDKQGFQILNSLMMIGVTQSLFKVIGYNGMFLLTGGVGIVGMFASWLMPREISSEDFRGRFQSNPL